MAESTRMKGVTEEQLRKMEAEANARRKRKEEAKQRAWENSAEGRKYKRMQDNGTVARAEAVGINAKDYVNDQAGLSRHIKEAKREQGVNNQRAFEKARTEIQNEYAGVGEQQNVDVSQDWKKQVEAGYVKTGRGSWSKQGDRNNQYHQTMMRMINSGNKFTGMEFDLHFGAEEGGKDRYARYGGFDNWRDNYSQGRKSFHGDDYVSADYVKSDEFKNQLKERNDKISNARARHIGVSGKDYMKSLKSKSYLGGSHAGPKHHNAGKYVGDDDYVHDYHPNDPGYQASQDQAARANSETAGNGGVFMNRMFADEPSGSSAAQVSSSYQNAKNKAKSWFLSD